MSELLLEWIPKVMNQLGYFGIALLMFLENLFPPIPSELIMPLAGFTVAKGDMAFVPAVVAGVVGTVLGAYPWYYIGKFVSEERLEHLTDKYGKWLGLGASDIHKANNWFNKHGSKAVLLCRLVPGVRTLISLPAGINGMALLPFTLYSTLGTTLWVGFLTAAGYKLGDHYDLVDEYLGPVSKIIFASLIIFVVLWVVRKRLRQAS
jgi:membrane protein DedA with SNARE-associated domain